MKKTIVLMGLVTSFAVSSNCIPVYQDRISDLQSKMDELEPTLDKKVLTRSGLATVGAVAGGAIGNEIFLGMAVGGGSALGCTVPVAGVVAGGLTALTLYEVITAGDTEDDYYGLMVKRDVAKESLDILREAEAKDGRVLKKWMPYVIEKAGNDVSVIDLANSISELNNQGVYCEIEDLDAVGTIVEKSIENLK